MARAINTDPGDGGGGTIKYPKSPIKPGSPIGGSPGLLTSLGGLSGSSGLGGNFGACYLPMFSRIYNKAYLYVIDPSDFNCEEDVEYDFPNNEAQNGVTREVTVRKVLLTYRELGEVTFTVGVQVYSWLLEQQKKNPFLFEEVTYSISNPNRKGRPFPDQEIHTAKIDIVVTGARPLPYITRKANKGPLSIISLTLVGTQDEGEQS